MSKNKKLLIFLMALGVCIRIPGLFWEGNHDMRDASLPWGQSVLNKGFTEGFLGIYFPITYIFFGVSAWIAKIIPDLWFLPFKATNLFFEFALLQVFFTFYAKKKKEILYFYWLNPWFILLGTWQGFWDALMVTFLLLSSLIFESKKIKYGNLISGLLMGSALMVKPQSQVVIISVCIFFLLRDVIRFKLKRLAEYLLGVAFPFLMFSAYFWINGKPITFLLKHLIDTRNVFPVLVATEINIWHPISRILQILFNQPGRIYNINLGDFWFVTITNLSILSLLMVITYFIYKTKARLSDVYVISLWLLPQIVVMSHVNHFISASILAIPYIIKHPKLKWPWIVTVGIHTYNAFVRYGFGPNVFFNMEKLDMGLFQSFLGVAQFIITVYVIKIFFDIRKPKKENVID